MCVCVCIYIYVYIYIYGCVYMGLCVCSWMGGQGGDLIFSIFEVAPECPEDLSLSILVWRPHKELCLWKPARPEERVKDVSQSRAEGQTFQKLKVGLQNGQLGVRLQSMESRYRAMKAMARWVSIFGRCVGQRSRVSNNKYSQNA